MSKEEWEALRGLADSKSLVIKQADKGSCVWLFGEEMTTSKKLISS